MTIRYLMPILMLCSMGAYAEKSCCAKKASKKESAKKHHAKKHTAHVHDLVDEADYKKRISEKKHVIVKFYSSACPACQKIAPVFEEAAKKHKNILFLNVFLDKEVGEGKEKTMVFDDLADALAIENIPAIIFIKDGKVVDTKVGYYKQESFDKLVQDFMKPAPKKEEVKKPEPKKPEPKKELKKEVKPEIKKEEAPAAHADIVEIKTMEEYKKHTGANKKSVIKISTSWCGACTMFAPDFKAVGEQFKDKAGFFMINGDNPELKAVVKEHASGGYPTTIFLIDGKVVDTKVGAYPRKVLESLVLEFTRK